MIRAKLILAGIADPLRTLPDLHALLDVAESLISEGMDKAELDKFHAGLYMPALGTVPEGFADDDLDDAFAAFEAAATGAQ